MMTHFNELNTLGVDRDRGFRDGDSRRTDVNFTEMNGEVAVGLSSGTSGHRGVLSPQKKKEVCGLQRF